MCRGSEFEDRGDCSRSFRQQMHMTITRDINTWLTATPDVARFVNQRTDSNCKNAANPGAQVDNSCRNLSTKRKAFHQLMLGAPR